MTTTGSNRREHGPRPPSRSALVLILLAACFSTGAALNAPTPPVLIVDRGGVAEMAGPTAGARVLWAVRTLIRDHPETFPQPPPVDIHIGRADPNPHRLGAAFSYGGAELYGTRVMVWIERGAVAGPYGLNDAELRSFLGHELLHAYQYRFGPYEPGTPEFFRREIEAYRWELDHMSPAVRPFYRSEAELQRELFESLLETAHEPPPPETGGGR